MPVRAETEAKKVRETKGDSWGEIQAGSQKVAWQVLETFPKEVEVIRTELNLTLGFSYAESFERAIEAGVIPGTSLIWHYESSRDVVKPDRMEFRNGVEDGGDYRINDNLNKAKRIYRKEAEILKLAGKAVLAGGKINNHSFDLGRGGLNALREEQLAKLKAQGYSIEHLSLWLGQHRYTGYNEDVDVDMASGLNFSSTKSTVKLYLDQLYLKPAYLGISPQLSMEDAGRTMDWFLDLKAKVLGESF